MTKIDQTELLFLIADALECEPETLSPQSGLGHHYNWDSLGHLTIMVALENRYCIEINESNILNMLTVKDITDYLEKNI